MLFNYPLKYIRLTMEPFPFQFLPRRASDGRSPSASPNHLQQTMLWTKRRSHTKTKNVLCNPSDDQSSAEFPCKRVFAHERVRTECERPKLPFLWHVTLHKTCLLCVHGIVTLPEPERLLKRKRRVKKKRSLAAWKCRKRITHLTTRCATTTARTAVCDLECAAARHLSLYSVSSVFWRLL